MMKSKISSIKILSKKEQKAITGGMCPGGGYPIPCGKTRKCPEACELFDIYL